MSLVLGLEEVPDERYGGVPKTAMILNTSTTPILGLIGRRTKVGVKKTLIHRSPQPACGYINWSAHPYASYCSMHTETRRGVRTGTSRYWVKTFVRWVPKTSSDRSNVKKRSIRQATEAGNVTCICLRSTSTAKQARSINVMPKGM